MRLARPSWSWNTSPIATCAVCDHRSVPAGTLRWSHTAQVAIGDVFQLQDGLASRIVESLELPLSTHDQKRLRHDVPSSPKAYEFYLRANQLSYDTAQWHI